jgi:hypothetical protein
VSGDIIVGRIEFGPRVDSHQGEAVALRAQVAQLRAALEVARDALYNGFEPDNQGRAYHVVCDALKASA